MQMFHVHSLSLFTILLFVVSACSSDEISCNIGSTCDDGKLSHCEVHARLYDWAMAQSVCPVGWHLPTDVGWTELTDQLGGELVAAGKMKEEGLAHWTEPNTGDTNSSRFTATTGGERNINGLSFDVGDYGNWWTSTESDAIDAICRYLYYENDDVTSIFSSKGKGYSVRCIRD